MKPNELTLGGIADALVSHPEVRMSAVITAPGTGNRALTGIRLPLARQLVALKYRQPEELDGLVGRYQASLDVVIADPNHGYGSSVHCLERCLELLSPGGILLCHDCMPPPTAASLERVADTEWCGVTFAAFRDVMTAGGVGWCTLAADYGIGIAIAPSEAARCATSIADAWTLASHGAYLERYLADPFRFMRAVRPEEWRTAVDRLRARRDISDLAAKFGSWDELRPFRDARSESPIFRQGFLRLARRLRRCWRPAHH